MKNSDRTYKVKGTPFFVWKAHDCTPPLWVIDSNDKKLIDRLIKSGEDQCWFYKAEAMEMAKYFWIEGIF